MKILVIFLKDTTEILFLVKFQFIESVWKEILCVWTVYNHVDDYVDDYVDEYVNDYVDCELRERDVQEYLQVW